MDQLRNLPQEWRKIEGFENYSVSSVGLVRNDLKNKYLSQSNSKEGYLIVNLETMINILNFMFID